MYVTLDRLRGKGYVRSKDEKGTPEREESRSPFTTWNPPGWRQSTLMSYTS